MTLAAGHLQRRANRPNQPVGSLFLDRSHQPVQDGHVNKITSVDVSRYALDIHRDLSVSTRIRKSGPPERIDGMTVGVVTITPDTLPPHKGEVHPDGDEILYVISGRLRIIGESDPTAAIDVGPGQACIIRKGEWHLVSVLDSPARLIHITPGPNGAYRPL